VVHGEDTSKLFATHNGHLNVGWLKLHRLTLIAVHAWATLGARDYSSTIIKRVNTKLRKRELSADETNSRITCSESIMLCSPPSWSHGFILHPAATEAMTKDPAVVFVANGS
jgi:hypothetical protein